MQATLGIATACSSQACAQLEYSSAVLFFLDETCSGDMGHIARQRKTKTPKGRRQKPPKSICQGFQNLVADKSPPSPLPQSPQAGVGHLVYWLAALGFGHLHDEFNGVLNSSWRIKKNCPGTHHITKPSKLKTKQKNQNTTLT